MPEATSNGKKNIISSLPYLQVEDEEMTFQVGKVKDVRCDFNNDGYKDGFRCGG